MHDLNGRLVAKGSADVETGRGMLANLIRRMIGFPPAGGNVPVTVTFELKDGVEIWTRSFAGVKFSSRQSVGRKRCERPIGLRDFRAASSVAFSG